MHPSEQLGLGTGTAEAHLQVRLWVLERLAGYTMLVAPLLTVFQASFHAARLEYLPGRTKHMQQHRTALQSGQFGQGRSGRDCKAIFGASLSLLFSAPVSPSIVRCSTASARWCVSLYSRTTGYSHR